MDTGEKNLVLAYYLYTPIENAEEFAAFHLEYCKKIGLKGRIYIADEGINGTASASESVCRKYMQYLRLIPQFSGIEFKVHESDHIPFRKLHVRYKKEIVNSGLTQIKPYKLTGKHLSPVDFKKLKTNPDVVIVDVRSNYETKLGKIKNAITFDIETFREFPEKVAELDEFKDKTIITYCTGGIKCEKASAFLLEQGFKDVYQLNGGILKYGEEAGGEDFDGKCYVFDGRISVEINSVNPVIVSTCIHCGEECQRMINCVNASCNEQIIMCEKCGWKQEGACSENCRVSNTSRAYNGTGYYTK
jgi:UPF0176 protein